MVTVIQFHGVKGCFSVEAMVHDEVMGNSRYFNDSSLRING